MVKHLSLSSHPVDVPLSDRCVAVVHYSRGSGTPVLALVFASRVARVGMSWHAWPSLGFFYKNRLPNVGQPKRFATR